MRFEDALRERRAPEKLGDVRLSYDPPVLVGQTSVERGWRRYLPDALFVGALGCGVGAVGGLVANPGGAVTLPVLLTAAAAVLVVLAAQAERRVRRPRRFALNFLDETLRVELSGAFGRRGRALTVPLDEVRDVYAVERRDGCYSLRVDFTAGGRTLSALLVDRVPPEERAELGRLWSALRAAFALTPPPPEG